MSDNIERTLGRVEQALCDLGEKMDAVLMNRREDDERIRKVETVQSRLIWTGSGAFAVIAFVFSIVLVIVKA